MTQETTRFLSEGSLPETKKVQGSNPAPSTIREPRLFDARILQLVVCLQSRGYAEKTLKGILKRLMMLSKSVNLDDVEAVKRFVASKSGWSNVYKETIVNAYDHYVREHGLVWCKPFYRRSKRLPCVPTEEQVNRIIAHSGRKYGLVFSVLRDTGLRPCELHRLQLKQIDLENGLMYPESAKDGSARVLKLRQATLAMLKEYIDKHGFSLGDRPFPDSEVASHVYMRIRNRLAQRMHEPELKRFRLYDLRHFYATMLYHKTKDILYVKQQMGHKRLETTLIYTQLVNFSEDDYTSATAKTVAEAQKLVECGFEYVCDIEGVKLFRKRK